MCHVSVEVRPYKKPPGPSQCYRCQFFGHGSSQCNRPMRCVRCSGSYRRQDCTRDASTAGECCKCGEAHNASYKGCKAFKQAGKLQRPRGKQPADFIQPAEPASEDTSLDGEEEAVETDSQPAKPEEKRKRPPRNPADRGPKPPTQREDTMVEHDYSWPSRCCSSKGQDRSSAPPEFGRLTPPPQRTRHQRPNQQRPPSKRS